MMKKTVFFSILTLFATVGTAHALPTCMPQSVGAKFVSRWQKEGEMWRISFTCDNYQKAKVYAVDVVDPADTDATYLVVDDDDNLESQDIFYSPCEAMTAFCNGTINRLSPEMKAAVAKHFGLE